MKQGMKKGMKQFWLVMLFVFALLHAGAAPALADAPPTIIRDAPAIVPSGQTLQSLVVVDQDATISGTVRDVVFVYRGDVRLTATAKTGIVVVLGGSVQQESGAVVDDGIVSMALDQPLWNSFLLGMVMMAGFWGLRLLATLILILLPLLGMLLLRHRATAPLQLLEQYAVKMGVAGVIVLGVTFIVSVLIGLTVVGLPVSFLLLGLLALAAAIGYPLVAYRLGEWMLQRHEVSGRFWVPSLTGAAAIAAVSNIPLFGGLLLIGVASVSIGTTITWLLQGWKKKARKKSK
jgi:hypothetical protein